MLRIAAAVVVMLVASSSSGLANCAWVLWKKTETLQARRPTISSWEIETATPDFEGCGRAQRESLDTYMKQGPLESKPRTKGGANSILVSVDGQGSMILTFLCLPDNVDPRPHTP